MTREEVRRDKVIRIYRGWGGARIFEFADGSKWRQINPKHFQKFKYHPQAKVLKDGEGFCLDIEGTRDPVRVERIW